MPSIVSPSARAPAISKTSSESASKTGSRPSSIPTRLRNHLICVREQSKIIVQDAVHARIIHAVEGLRQLQEVMAAFWFNHFNVFAGKGLCHLWVGSFEQEAIRPHTMGRFRDLLGATAQHPTMLFYRDNWENSAPNGRTARGKFEGINETYARELMELHTLGVDGGYTQKDVTEVAKVFTGWTIEDPRKGSGFTFNDRRHEPGPKYVLGKTIRDNGEQEGLEVLHMLATSPATARHISRELAVRFVSDNPPPALVDRTAKTYLKTGGDIRQVLRTLFASPEFWSKDAYRAKVKTPEEFVISAIRATNGEIVRPVLLLNAMNQLGMPFYGCQTPNGYSWTAEPWVNTGDLLNRMNIALALASHRLGTVTDMDALMGVNAPDAGTVAEKEAKLENIVLDGQLSPQTREALLEQVGQGMPQQLPPAQVQAEQSKQPGLPARAGMVQMIDMPAPIAGPTDKQAALLAGLLLGSPEFQRK
jgi:uncharacterized protein (DUF1800 family)